MEIKNYEFHQDPGHGWVKVPIKELEVLGIKDEISTFSYIKGEFAYLEEDCDASLFVEALKKRGVTPNWQEIHTNYDSNIRNYERFKGSQ